MTLEKRIKQFLEHPELRFTKIRYKTKRPIEKNWTKRPYTYDEIQNHIQHHTNYGVLTGHGDLAVADADTKELASTIETKLPPTFTVQTGGGGRHYYYKCPEIQKRIVLEQKKQHHGEIQSKGQAVVGPGSLHPSGSTYEILRDHPFTEITYDELKTELGAFFRPKKTTNIQPPQSPRNPAYSHINSIPITSVIDISEFKTAQNGELYGPNPWHGSTTGANTWINLNKNVAYCFRHNTGISVAKAVALNTGLLSSCDDQLTKSQFHQLEETAFSHSKITQPYKLITSIRRP